MSRVLLHSSMNTRLAKFATPRRKLLLSSISCAALLTGAGAASAAPSGGHVVAGQANIAVAPAQTTITQTSKTAIINWSDFSIAHGSSVQFNNGTGATLNRVASAAGTSIDGLLNATGSVYVIDPKGVVIGKHGVVNVGGSFVASTLDVPDSQFLSGGPMTFSGASTAGVVNLGKIGALGGHVALIATAVENDGAITAPAGTVGLIAGREVTLTDQALDGGLFAVQIGGAETSATNSGSISAAAAELRAQGGNVYALAGNTGGVINATEVSGKGGHIWLTAPGGSVSVASGAVLDASAGQNGDGGQILVDSVSTTFAGTALARGGALSGNGGKVETSGDTANTNGARVNTTAPHGKTGLWLIDPNNYTVAASGGDITGAQLSSNLATTDVLIQSNSGGASGSGDINVNDAVSWSTPNSSRFNYRSTMWAPPRLRHRNSERPPSSVATKDTAPRS